jgi:glycosyltransferase involved in cell wall biosynthesis
MKILFSGYHNPHFPTITEYTEEAIEELGHRLVRFENRRYRIPGRIRDRVPALERVDLRRINRDLLRLARETRPDVFVETGGHRILPSSVDRMRRNGVATVLWTIDAPTDFGPVVKAAPHYDSVVCGGTEAIELLEQAGVTGATWLPFACSPARHRAPALSADDRERFGADVAFVGSHYPNRADVLARLANLDLAIWGPGWNRLPEADPLRSRLRDDHVDPEDWAKIYAASRVVVIIHYQDGRVPCHQASPKVYETLACGGFAVVDDQKDVFALFEDGYHLVRFRDPDRLAAEIEALLSRPDHCTSIARRGREEVLSKHTYRHRVQSLLERLPQ